MAITSWYDILQGLQGGGPNPFPGMGLPDPSGWRDDLPFWGINQAPYYTQPGEVPSGYTNPFKTTTGGQSTTINPAATGSTSTTTAGGGLAPLGWETPVGDPLRALTNTLRGQGRFVNPFNRSGMAGLQHIAKGLIPQYFAELLSQGESDFAGGSAETQFGDFLRRFTTGQFGQGGISTPAPLHGYQRSTQSLEQVNELLRQISWAMGGGGADVDFSDPVKTLEAINALPDFNMKQKAIAGLLLGDPSAQQAYYLSGYAPSLGPTMLQGLGTVAGAQRSLWDDLLGDTYFQAGKPFSFLDVLLGKTNTPFSQWPR